MLIYLVEGLLLLLSLTSLETNVSVNSLDLKNPFKLEGFCRKKT